MSKIRYAIIGSGWRSLYFIRIAKALPELFEVTGVLVRNEEKRKLMTEEYRVPAVMSREELLAAKPDFVVTAVSRGDNFKICKELMELGVPVLSETPPADSLEELLELWKVREECDGKIQVAEQYFLYPNYQAKLAVAQGGYLGKIQNASLSALHEYHGFSILRLALGAGCSDVAITAKKYVWPIAVTQNRGGVLQKGEVKDFDRVKAELVFENGTVGFYDFCGVQYHSHVRSRHFSIQGERGELFDNKVYYLNEDDDPMIETLTPVANDGLHMGIDAIAFGGKAVYRNPFPTNVLNEDETAVARLLVGMKEYLETGKEVYPIADAMQDAYLTVLMAKAVESGETVSSTKQPWAN